MKIFQIFYDDLTREKLDDLFIPLDNSNSTSKEWYEYSAIRNVLKKESFDKDEYIGFFSPRFLEKTGLRAIDVEEKVKKSTSMVISFSPRFDQISYFNNPFFQGNFYHKGLLELSKKVFLKLCLPVNLDMLVTDQTRSIFSNYFVAKYSFWQKYFAISEKIFEMSQDGSELAALMNSKIRHRNLQDYTLKVFLMERLVTIILEIENLNAEIGFDHKKSLDNLPKVKPLLGNLLILDALKTAFIKTNKNEFIDLYHSLRIRTPLMEILHGDRKKA